MNGFRLMLCILGLIAYVVTKQFTAPDNEVSGFVSPGQFIGLSLSLPQPEPHGGAMLWMSASSNAEPSLLHPVRSEEPSEPASLSLNVSARNKRQSPVHHPGFNGSMRLERN